VLSEGKKTVALEIAEQCGWNVPDYVFVPVGDGCIIGGVYKGFYDLLQLGWTGRIPKIIAVQSELSSAISDALLEDKKIKEVNATTLADSISVNLPRDGLKAVRAVRNSEGFAIKVSDGEILKAQKELSTKAGIFSEPAAAASYAGLLKAKAEKRVEFGARVTLLVTGSGLKDVKGAQSLLKVPRIIKPELEDFEKALSEEKL